MNVDQMIEALTWEKKVRHEMETKVSELQGPALDWAVAKCEGFEPFSDSISWIIDDNGTYRQLFRYSTDWLRGGPIIEREMLQVSPEVGKEGSGNAWWCVAITPHEAFGPTPLIAAMRCYVASKLGDEIELPEELK